MDAGGSNASRKRKLEDDSAKDASSNSDKTLILLKQDCVRRGLIGMVLNRLTVLGFEIQDMFMIRPVLQVVLIEKTHSVEICFSRTSVQDMERHYEEHRDKPFFTDLCKRMTNGRLVVLVVTVLTVFAESFCFRVLNTLPGTGCGKSRQDCRRKDRLQVTLLLNLNEILRSSVNREPSEVITERAYQATSSTPALQPRTLPGRLKYGCPMRVAAARTDRQGVSSVSGHRSMSIVRVFYH